MKKRERDKEFFSNLRWILKQTYSDCQFRFDDEKPQEGPTKLTKLQFIPAIASYVIIVALSVSLMLLMKHVPGADLAANFLE